ncbi:MAG: response regulator [Candidatus Riflebacteria bacterium]|nr:response regulator [Candidatus Riflebacteria bacterium]
MPKILTIDDKMDNLITLSALLKNLMPECVVITAQSGHEGIEKAKTELPDTILLDVKMPDMDGYETCRRLMADENTRTIPVIMITAIKTDQQSRIKGLDIGANAFLSKPIDEVELVSQVKVALRIRQAEESLRRERNSLEKAVQERTASLRQSEEYYRSLFENMIEGFAYCRMLFDGERAVDFIYLNVNTAFETLTGLKNVIGKKVSEVIPGIRDQDPEIFEIFGRVVLNGKPERFEKLIKAMNMWFSISAYRPENDHFVVVFDVITKRKQAEEELVRHMERTQTLLDLHKKGEEEKNQLQEQLFQAQKMEAIGTLAGGIAHDFNNILAAIMGFTELALDGDLKEDQRRNLQAIMKGAERARNLVKQILTFSRRDNPIKKPLDCRQMLEETVKFLRASIPATIEIRQKVTDDSCNIAGDPTQVHQIIMNLCTNAVYAMKQTGGILTIQLSTIDATRDKIQNHPDLKGHYVQLTISDTGAGVAPMHLHRIFDPFFTTKSRDEGTGLGLSVVSGIVRSHGGVIHVSSEPGKGSSFSVYLPRLFFEPIANETLPETITGGKEHILFVDDEPSLVDVGMLTLTSMGYEVLGTTGSREALDLFCARPDHFDLIITDMILPQSISGIGGTRLKKIFQV